jgi:hypothetical protein
MICALLIVLSCFSSGQTQSESGTGLEGVIMMSPSHAGPARDDMPNSEPLANAAFDVQNEMGKVTSFTTDDQGRFRISLAPGHYTVSMQNKERRVRGCGQFDVDVVAVKMTKVEWRCDTGMR